MHSKILVHLRKICFDALTYFILEIFTVVVAKRDARVLRRFQM